MFICVLEEDIGMHFAIDRLADICVGVLCWIKTVVLCSSILRENFTLSFHLQRTQVSCCFTFEAQKISEMTTGNLYSKGLFT